jgi:Flp pilus assembly protein TadD
MPINPESPEINANMAYSLYKIGKSNEALPYAKKARELLPGNDRIQI